MDLVHDSVTWFAVPYSETLSVTITVCDHQRSRDARLCFGACLEPVAIQLVSVLRASSPPKV
eukprot:2215501-Amphidinium_carterae.1